MLHRGDSVGISIHRNSHRDISVNSKISSQSLECLLLRHHHRYQV